MTSLEQRRDRVRAGSGRKRDLAAVGLTDHADREASKRAEEAVAQREREDRLRPQVRQSDAAQSAWAKVQSALGRAVPESTFRIWLEPLACIGEVSGALAIEAPEGLFAWTFRHYAGLLGATVRGATDYRGLFLFRGAAPAPGDD
jgi:hypothetical protein